MCVTPNCSFAAIFGSRYLGQTWKKASSGSGRRSPQRFGHSTRNIWPASSCLTRRSILRSSLGNCSQCVCARCPSAEAFDSQKIARPTSSRNFQSCVAVKQGVGQILSRPLLNGNPNHKARTKEGRMVTGGARPRRGKWRRVKSRRKTKKAMNDSASKTVPPEEVMLRDQPDRLLLSALKYWEVERDLIEERLATKSATAAS